MDDQSFRRKDLRGIAVVKDLISAYDLVLGALSDAVAPFFPVSFSTRNGQSMYIDSAGGPDLHGIRSCETD